MEDIPIGVQIEDYNSSTERILTMTDAPPRVLPYLNTMLNSVTYEVNHQRILIERVEYGIFEWLGEIGGLGGALYGFFGTILMLFLVRDGA